MNRKERANNLVYGLVFLTFGLGGICAQFNSRHDRAEMVFNQNLSRQEVINEASIRNANRIANDVRYDVPDYVGYMSLISAFSLLVLGIAKLKKFYVASEDS